MCANNSAADFIFAKNLKRDFDIYLIPMFICWPFTLYYVSMFICTYFQIIYTYYIQESFTFSHLLDANSQFECEYLLILRLISD